MFSFWAEFHVAGKKWANLKSHYVGRIGLELVFPLFSSAPSPSTVTTGTCYLSDSDGDQTVGLIISSRHPADRGCILLPKASVLIMENTQIYSFSKNYIANAIYTSTIFFIVNFYCISSVLSYYLSSIISGLDWPGTQYIYQTA